MRRFIWALAGVMAFTLASIHIFAVELYLLSLAVFAVAVVVLVRWRPHLGHDVRRVAVLLGTGVVLAVPMVFARAQGAGLVSADESGVDEYGALLRVAGVLEKSSLLDRLGDGALSPITSLSVSEWAADELYVYRPLALGYREVLSGETLTYLLVLLLLPSLLLGRRLSVFLVATTVVVPLVVFNPLVVTPLYGRVDDIALLRLPQLVPNALVWVAVLAPLADRVGRLALRHKPGLTWRYALACGRRLLRLGGLGGAVPAGALAGVYGFGVAAVIVAAGTFATSDIVDGVLYKYLQSEDTVLSVRDSRATRLRPDEGVFGYLRENAPADAVVLADPVSSYYIAGFVGTPVVAVPWSHSPRRVERVDGPRRRLDAETALSGGSYSASLEVVRRYRVTYVLTKAAGRAVFDEEPGMFRVVYEDDESRVYKFAGADD